MGLTPSLLIHAAKIHKQLSCILEFLLLRSEMLRYQSITLVLLITAHMVELCTIHSAKYIHTHTLFEKS